MSRKQEKQEDILTAVVIADNYNNNFAPLTPAMPHCLQTCAGRPLLDYTLEWLMINSVKEVILYLSSSPAEVKNWLTGSKWSQEVAEDCRPLNITVIVNEDSRSLGDACRDLDEKGIVRGHFLLCQGDLVSNVKLTNMVETHKERMVKDKNGVMTKVMMTGGSGDVTRCRGEEVVVATDKITHQILFHQRSNLTGHNFPIELFQHDEVSVLSDLTDPDIYMCSPAVLTLFSDNFDKQDMDTLVAEILESDLTDYTIYLEILNQGAAARASNPYLLTMVNSLVLSRWMYPLVPHPSNYKYSLGHVYQGRNIKVGKGTLLDESVLIGQNTVVGRVSSLTCSTIGQDCVIGDNCVLDHCVLEAGVRVGDGVVLRHCVVGRDCVISAGARLGEKLILGCGVELGPGAVLEDAVRVVATLEDDWGDDTAAADDNLGPKAFIFTGDDDEDEDDDDLAGLGVEHDPWGQVYVTDEDCSDDEDSDEEDDEDEEVSEEEESDDGEHDDVKNFRREVMDSILRGLDQGVAPDNLVLEINGSKHAWNTTLSEVNQCVLYSVLTANIDLNTDSAKTILPSVIKNINKLTQLLVKYSKSKSGQQYYLEGIEIVVSRHSIFLDILPKILQNLYDKDVLTDDNILLWNNKLMSASKQDQVKTKLVSKLKPFIEWLEQSESESD